MATSNGKRTADEAEVQHAPVQKVARLLASNGTGNRVEHTSHTQPSQGHISIQIVTGSYERILHGIYADITPQSLHNSSQSEPESENVTFSDTFLFAAHASSIRCLALSPPTESSKRILATGSSDERINLYSLSTTPPADQSKPTPISLDAISIQENPRNRSLGNLLHHDRAITRLHFPTKSKLFSSAEDNTIAISRTRDWTVLSSIKAPVPKPQGRPSGDTAGPGEVPAGVNDFAIHPSQKLMLSVGRGEKCMRLWNLMTGKKAGVLNFDRDLLAQVGEARYGNGEGRAVLWDESGEKFVVAFERGAVVFGIDSQPKAILKPSPPTKLHQMRFVPRMSESDAESVLAVSTEDGRILFYDSETRSDEVDAKDLPSCHCLAELGGASAGISGRVKDFEILPLSKKGIEREPPFLIITGSSDGAIRLWSVYMSELKSASDLRATFESDTDPKVNGDMGRKPSQIRRLIGTLETGNRVTCLEAFVMDEKAVESVDVVDDVVPEAEESESEGDT